jgi:hypothetical protein
MKHFFYTLALFAAFLTSAAAQEQTLFYGNTPKLYDNPFGSGYICGTNSYGDVGKYQRFDFVPSAKVTGATFRFGAVTINGTADVVNMVAREVGLDGKPGNVLQTVVLNTAQFNLDSTGKRFDFPLPINVAAQGSIFIGLEWDTTIDDEFGLISDLDGEGESADRAWEQFPDGTLQAINDQGTFAWGYDIDIFIKAHYLNLSATNELDNALFSFGTNSPNPFLAATTFQVNLKENAQRATLKLFDATGREVRVLADEPRQAGVWKLVYQKDLPAGTYFACLNVDGRSAVRSISIW